MDLYAYVGTRIRELREQFGPGGLSQEALAKKVGVAANTISRWETATYQPTLKDLEALARFFGVSILEFLPKNQAEKQEKVNALLHATRDLNDDDLEELKNYAEFRRARHILKSEPKRRPGRKAKQER